jgi:hypothetical protein
MRKSLQDLERINMKVTLKQIDAHESNVLVLSHAMVESFPVIPKRIFLKIGSWKSEVIVKISAELPKDTIGLSHALKLPFEIPLHLQYEANMKGRELHIGPILAFLAFKKKSELTEQLLNEYQTYFNLVSRRSGLIVICAADGINIEQQTMEGCYLHYSPNENKPICKFGTFPLPNALYNILDLDYLLSNKLLVRFGETFINTYYFNREEWSSWLRSNCSLRPYILNKEDVITIKGNENVHFKVIMQKDSSKYWNCSGIIACQLKDKEDSSKERNSLTLSGYLALRDIFKMTEREIFVKEREMIDLCTLSCKTLEQCGGNYGDLLFDIVLDKKMKLSVTNILPSYDHTLPLTMLNDKEMYLKVVTTPFEYARSLAGFK